jgi:hypothetical protein
MRLEALIFVFGLIGISIIGVSVLDSREKQKKEHENAFIEGCRLGSMIGDLPKGIDGEAAEIYVEEFCKALLEEYKKNYKL